MSTAQNTNRLGMFQRSAKGHKLLQSSLCLFLLLLLFLPFRCYLVAFVACVVVAVVAVVVAAAVVVAV